LRKDFTSGKTAQQIKSLNTATYHLDSLVSAYKAMENSNFPTGNAAENLLAKYLPVTEGLLRRQGNITNITTKFNAVKGELATTFKANGATDQEIKAWGDTIGNPANATPVQWQQFVNGAIDLMAGRLKAQRDTYEKGMGEPMNFQMLNTSTRNILQRLGLDVDTIDPIAPSPQGIPQANMPSIKLPAGYKAGW
jgi:uncharacterized protein (UPF0333 family)